MVLSVVTGAEQGWCAIVYVCMDTD